MGRLVHFFPLLCQVISVYSRQNQTVCIFGVSDNSPCQGGDAALTHTSIWVRIRGFPSTSSTSEWLAAGDPGMIKRTFNLTFTPPKDYAELSFVQPEHGGSTCNCWEIYFSSNCSMYTNELSGLRLCGGSASLPRRKKIIFYSLENITETEVEDEEDKAIPFNVTCNDTTPRIEVSFSLFLNQTSSCNTINEFNEGIEFSIHLSSKEEEWIPIRFIYPATYTTDTVNISIGDKHKLILRGYSVKVEELNFIEGIAEKNVSIQLCDFEPSDYFQFRWLQTSQHQSNGYARDVWSLDDVKIKLVSSTSCVMLINESFDNTLGSTNWPLDHVRNGDILDYCTKEGRGNALVFGYNDSLDISISSHSLLTPSFSFCKFFFDTNGTSDSLPGCLQPCLPSPTFPTDESIVTGNDMTTELPELIDEQRIKNKVPSESLALLLKVSLMENSDAFVVVYLLASIVNVINRSNIAALSDSVIQAALAVENAIIQSQQSFTITSAVVGTSLLLSSDTLLLNLLLEPQTFVIDNIVLHVIKVNVTITKNENITAINTSDILGPDALHTSMEIPLELLRMFADDSGRVRVMSSVHMNVTPLFPDGLPTRNESRLVSDLVSSSVQCGMEICTTNNLNLTSPVRINFEHSESLTEELKTNGSALETICVFLDIPSSHSLSTRNVLNLGHWSNRGCTRNDQLSSTSMTVCECNHLTHFGILLSARPPKLDRPEAFSLMVISYLGTTLSIISMALVVLTFTMLKSLHNTRNYIHVNLCINLSIAQLISVTGLDRANPNSDVVPVHCQVVAVLVQYFLLVSFMWMLMEGVILYVVLVHVFVDHKSRYVLAFTLASYGIPLLYMGLLTLPLGFAPNRELQYGNKYVCFLRWKTYFIFAFISPVVLIFIANIGFFIMAAKITWHHQMKQSNQKNLQNVRSWMKSMVSLMVVMGLTWIPSLLVVDVGLKEAGTVLEYISTFLVAFQGFFIFLIFVVFSKAVQEAYAKWWKTKVNESEVLSKYFGEKITLETSKGQSSKTPKRMEQPLDILHNGEGGGMERKMHYVRNQYNNDLPAMDNKNKKTDLETETSISGIKEYPEFAKEDLHATTEL